MAEERQVSAAELADSIEHYANAFRVFRDGFEMASKVRGLEQNERELNERVNKLGSDVKVAQAKHDKTLEDLENQRKDAEQRAKDAEARAQGAGKTTRANAADEASRIVAKAEAEADSKRQEAKAAEDRRDRALEQANRATVEAREAERRLAEAKGQISRLLTAGGV